MTCLENNLTQNFRKLVNRLKAINIKSLFHFLLGLFITISATGSPTPKVNSNKAGRTIDCNDVKAQKVFIQPGRVTILSFPLPPKEVLPGSPVFDFKPIKNDLAIKAIQPSGHTNVVVYLEQRRCIFDVRSVNEGGIDVLVVKDPRENLINWELK